MSKKNKKSSKKKNIRSKSVLGKMKNVFTDEQKEILNKMLKEKKKHSNN
ncbi:MAG: hypothetical protein ACOCQR_02400 [bacterium]